MFRFILLIAFFGGGNVIAGDLEQRHGDLAQFIGSVGCRSSSCHGGAGEKRDQYNIWSSQDFHSRAQTILLGARSARMAEALGTLEAANNVRCTVCHSPFQAMPASRLASTARADEGVSCETCHGAAGQWLRGHTRPDWTYVMRVSAGMRDLRNLYERANACVACHQNIDADLLRAGHPRLVFELDSQSVNEPRHWRETDSWIGPRSWLAGQAVAFREISWALERVPPGSRSDLLNEWNSLRGLLDKTSPLLSSSSGGSSGLTTADSFAAARHRADGLARAAVKTKWDSDSVWELLGRLASDSPSTGEGARRLILALDSLVKASNANRPGSVEVNAELDALRQDVREDYSFDAADFARHLGAFRAKLDRH